MVDRQVKVVLGATNTAYVKAFDDAANATRKLSAEGEKLANTRQALTAVGAGAVAMGALIAAGVGVAIAKYAEFDQAMSNVIATGADARANQDALRQAALDAGASTVFSARESANAIEELAKAGVSSTNILGGGLAGALDLAAAGGLDVASAAGIAATALQTFNLKGTDMAHVADLLAAGAGKAMGDVQDLSMALNQSALVASQTGLSIEETTAGLAAFASQGLVGSDAGTSFKTMLLALNPTTDEASSLMKELNLSAYDQQGNFIGLAAYAGKLESALGGMSAEQQNATLKTIFGNDAYRAAAVLLDEGQSGIEGWTDAVNDQGYAAETAATRLDNLAGDVEKFTGALDTAFIMMGSAADGPLRGLVQGLTGLVDAFNELPVFLQQTVLGVGAVAAGVLILGGALLIGSVKLLEFRAHLATLGVTAASTRGALGAAAAFLGGPWGIALAAATIGITLLAQAQADARAKADAYASTLEKGTNKVTESTREMAQEALAAKNSFLWLEQDSAYDAAEKLGIGLDLVTEAATGNVESMKELEAQLKAVDDGSLSVRNSIADVEAGVDTEAAAIARAAEASEQKADADRGAVGAAGEHAGAIEELAAAADNTTGAVEGLEDAIRNFGSATFDTEAAAIAFNAAFADLNAILAEGKGSLDITTEAGRATVGQMLDAAKSTNDYAASVAAMGGSTEQIQGILATGRQNIHDTRVALGESEDAAWSYANQLIQTPEAIATAVALYGVQQAENDLNYIARARYATIRAVVSGTAPSQGVDRAVANGGMFAYANGGFPTGIYKGRAGSIHKFAEPETGWEAYISGKPSQKERNIGIWQETGRRLGATAFADGGMTGGGSGVGGVWEAGPRTMRLLESLQPLVNVNVGEQSVATAANRGNANNAWRGGS